MILNNIIKKTSQEDVFFIYILNIPNASRTDDINIRTMQIGARYLIINVNRPFLLNLPDNSTSSVIV